MPPKTYNEVYKSRLREICEAISGRVTRRIAIHHGPKVPFYIISEFPRSGGSWLANMLADYLFCARPGSSPFPIMMRAVMHTHWKYHPKMRPVVYLMRDGRDVMTSYYFYKTRPVDGPRGGYTDKLREEWREYFGEDFDWRDAPRYMAAYIRREFAAPKGAYGLSWAGHVEMWCTHRDNPNVLFLTYEQLLADPIEQLARAALHLTGVDPDMRLIERSVNHHSMRSMTGRTQGQEDPGDFVRKGVAGDWVNNFSREAAEEFDRLAGDALVLAGYEPDRDWVDRYRYPEVAPSADAPARASA